MDTLNLEIRPIIERKRKRRDETRSQLRTRHGGFTKKPKYKKGQKGK